MRLCVAPSIRPNARNAFITFVSSVLLSLLVNGCASNPPCSNTRRFIFEQDTFSYANELVWEYHYNDKGKWVSNRREPPPDYSHHCFVLARLARQFFNGVRFDPTQPVADEMTYRRLIRQIASENPRRVMTEAEKVELPGYANLREFSAAHSQLLQDDCGGKLESYFQRGHWRMIFPFSREQQQKMSEQLLRHLKSNDPAVIHLARFPQLTINHAMVLFDAIETSGEILFLAYDPNKPDNPVIVTYERGSQTFFLPANDYFPGGRVDVYQVYHRWNY